MTLTILRDTWLASSLSTAESVDLPKATELQLKYWMQQLKALTQMTTCLVVRLAAALEDPIVTANLTPTHPLRTICSPHQVDRYLVMVVCTLLITVAEALVQQPAHL